MQIKAIQYSLKDRAYDVFVTGCFAPHCPGCHNPELQQFTMENTDQDVLIKIMDSHSQMVDRVRIMGGEPLDQGIDGLKEFIKKLKTLNKDIWIFTKYDPHELDDSDMEVLNSVQYVKHGRFIQDSFSYICPLTGIVLGSANQRVVAYARRE